MADEATPRRLQREAKASAIFANKRKQQGSEELEDVSSFYCSKRLRMETTEETSRSTLRTLEPTKTTPILSNQQATHTNEHTRPSGVDLPKLKQESKFRFLRFSFCQNGFFLTFQAAIGSTTLLMGHSACHELRWP